MFKDDGSSYFHFDDHCPGQPLQHPETSLMFRLLHLYEQNIHPLVRVVHMPSVRERLCDITADPAAANAQDHAIFFAMYTVTIGTLTEDESERLFGREERKVIWERHRRNTQTALCRADLMRSSSLGPVQAFMLYLLTLCKDVDPRSYGIFTGSATRMVQRLMVFRQSSRLTLWPAASNVTPVHQEMAVRLWWEVLFCDMRACEKSGISISASLATATTPLPRNASDADLDQIAAASTAPAPNAMLHVPNTECLFILLRAEIAQFQLHPPWSQQHPDHHLANHPFRSTQLCKQLFSRASCQTSTLACRLAAVDAFDTYIATRYFSRPETASSTLVRYAQHHARTWISKIRLFVHLNQRSVENDAEVIRICTVQIELAAKLIETKEFVRYQWYTYQQLPFFSFVILLDLLRRHTRGGLVDQAWKAIEGSAVIWRPDKGNSVVKDRSRATPSTSQSGGTGGEGATPNIYANWTDQNDSRKLQIRGTMLAALLVAAWEKRAQAVASESPTGRVPDEPAIVAAMRSAAIKHHDYATATGAHETATQGNSADQQAAYDLASFAAAQPDTQWQGGAADPTAFMAFLDPSLATSSATVDDMLNLNSLLQSSIDLDWSGWVHQSWGTPADMTSSADFIPSL
uniref:Xylanolytic transcriptional activator regulatory domain-containing protein n=2 Tax=Kalmanozyma brasiliensis (strain GHG001) TaxID=1365824 RepID=V5F3S6_KALBG